MTDPDVVWLQTPPNLLPVNPDTGGQALYYDWVTDTGALTVPVEVAPHATGTTATSLPVPVGTSVATRTPAVVPAALDAEGGLDYQFSTSATGPVLVEAYGVRTDGTLVWLLDEWYPGPAYETVYRARARRTLPAGFVGLAYRVLVLPASAYSYTAADSTWTLQWAWTDLNGDARTGGLYGYGDGSTLPDPGTGVALSDPVVVQGIYDPGPTPPTPSTDTFGALVWGSLPELYQRVDAQQTPSYPLLGYLQGAGVGSDDVMAVARQVYEGDMTDPVACPDAWLGWLVACLGVISAPYPYDQRQALLARQTAGRPGTAANLEAYIAGMLTGTKYVVVQPPGATPWMLRVSVIDAEAVAAGGPAGIRNRLLASGKLPAGHDVTVSTVLIAWDAVDARYGATWSPADEAIRNWADLDSTGLGG